VLRRANGWQEAFGPASGETGAAIAGITTSEPVLHPDQRRGLLPAPGRPGHARTEPLR